MSIKALKQISLHKFGFLLISIYCIFTLFSWVLYPQEYAPWTHYLSRLGNYSISPIGAYLYNIGCIATGISLIPFFLGISKWYSQNRFGKSLLVIGQFLGIFAAIALVSIGVFSEDQGAPHMTASSTFFVLNFFVLILINIGLLFHDKFKKGIGLYGISLTILSLPLEILVGGPLVEWYTVFGSLIFVGLLSYNSILLQDTNYFTQSENELL